MLKGDLASSPLPQVLRDLAEAVASGCLHVDDGVGGLAKVYLRGGQVYAVQVPGRRPQLGARLVSSGALGPEGLAEALEAQRTELQGWRLGELLVHLGYVDQPVVEAFVHEQVREQTSDLLRWTSGTWKFRVNERTREDVAPPTPVEELLADVAERHRVWNTITEVLHGPDAVPVLSASGQTDAEMSIDPEAWSLLCKVDGMRSVADLAKECGFTLFEAGQVVFALVRSGLLEVEEVVLGAEAPAPASAMSRLAAAFAPSPAAEPVAAEPVAAPIPSARADRSMADLREHNEDDVEGSLDRVSQALAALLGTTADDALFEAPKPCQPVRPMTADEQARSAKQAERAARDARRRERDSAELATAQAELEAARRAANDADAAALDPAHEAEIVSLEDVRREAARRDEEHAEAERLAAEQAAAAEAERLAAEQAAAAEAERVAAERAEAERVAAERAEAERLAAEQAAAERAAAEEELRRAAVEQERALAAQEQQARDAQELSDREATQRAAEEEDEEQRRLAVQRAEAGSAFAELSAAANSSSDVQVLEVEAPVIEEEADDVRPAYASNDTDMASLFRELSSLGMDDAPEPPPTRPPGTPPRPVATPAAKKKKGLFGR